MYPAAASVDHNPCVERIMDYVAHNYHTRLSTTGLAQMVGYNPNYLSTLFKRSTGVSMTHFINQTRIDAAKELLLSSSYTVHSIASQVGFCDEKHFMKLFRQHEGMTASAYRNVYGKIHINSR